MRAHERGSEASSADRRHRPPRPAAAGPAEEILALQRTIGNAATASLIEEARGDSVHDVLRSPGRPLPDPVRAEMEARLGADFSTVRVHEDSAAQRSAAELGARAYTSGEHVVIGAGGADPHTMAHELTHVIQQRSGPVSGTDNGSGLAISDPADRFEQAAEATAHRAMSGSPPAHSTVDGRGRARAGGAVQRTTVEEDGVTYTLSQNRKYAVLQDVGRSIWVAEGAPVSPALAERPNATLTIGGTEYREHQIRRWLLKDCLHTAEEIINNRPGELAWVDELPEDAPDEVGLNSRIRIGDEYEPFGKGYKENVALARKFSGAKDHDAAPGLDQAFVMIATKDRKGEEASPYHAAAVVGVDGNDRITLEEWSKEGKSSRGEARIYTVGDAEKSFHGYWETKYFGGRNPITVVVDPVEQPTALQARQAPYPLNKFKDAKDRDVTMRPPRPRRT